MTMMYNYTNEDYAYAHNSDLQGKFACANPKNSHANNDFFMGITFEHI